MALVRQYFKQWVARPQLAHQHIRLAHMVHIVLQQIVIKVFIIKVVEFK
jgi:hypothetical protein